MKVLFMGDFNAPRRALIFAHSFTSENNLTQSYLDCPNPFHIWNKDAPALEISKFI